MLLFVTSCSTYQIPKTIDEIPDLPVGEVIEATKPVEEPKPEVVLPEKKITKVLIKSLQGFSPEQEARFRKIVANVELVLNSEEYHQAILNHSWQGKKQFVDTTDTNEQVWEKLHSKDWELEYRLERLAFYSKVIGYTYPSVTWIAFNSRKWHVLSDAEIADNIFHEYGGHKLGRYGHAMKWNEARDYSAPYGIGYVAEKIYKQKFGDK